MSKMHSPLRYATNLLLERAGAGGLDDFLQEYSDEPAQVVTVKLSELTDGVIVVDRRTVSRWLAEVSS